MSTLQSNRRLTPTTLPTIVAAAGVIIAVAAGVYALTSNHANHPQPIITHTRTQTQQLPAVQVPSTARAHIVLNPTTGQAHGTVTPRIAAKHGRPASPYLPTIQNPGTPQAHIVLDPRTGQAHGTVTPPTNPAHATQNGQGKSNIGHRADA